MFYDRHDAGKKLAFHLEKYKGKTDALVLGLARGGVVVAFDVAKELCLPLNVIVPRKIGAPNNPELALGAIMENGEGIFNESIIRALGVSQKFIQQEIESEKAIAKQRANLYRKYTPLPKIQGKTVILVDDGIATGATMLSAIQGMRAEKASVIVVAAPVASTDAYDKIKEVSDEVVCPHVKVDFMAVGQYYENFRQTDDMEVMNLLKEASR